MPDQSRFYQQEELQEILNVAIARQGSDAKFSHEQLVEIAGDLGISALDLQVAEKEWLSQSGEQKERREFDLYRRKNLQKKVTGYILTSGFLITINLATASTISWAWYILGFWGLTLGVKAWHVFKDNSEDYNEAFHTWQRKQQIRQTVNSLWHRFNKFLEG